MRIVGGWRSFVAVGDSFTEGMDDPYPGGRSYRGWADWCQPPRAGREAERLPLRTAWPSGVGSSATSSTSGCRWPWR